MSHAWDFVVVGAGPAGSRVTELFSKQGYTVLLLDPNAPWEKPCGGGLTAAALRHTPELRELASQTVTVREVLVVAPGGASIVVPIRNPYEVVSRLTLSRWGLERARAAGARFLPAAAQTIDRHSDGWRLTDSRGTEHWTRWLIAADGATSRLRGELAPRLRPELAPTRVAYPQLRSVSGRAVFAFLRAADGYLWDFPRIGHHSVGIGVSPGTFARTPLDEAIAQYRLAEVGEHEPVEQRGAVIATSDWASGRFRDLGSRDYALLGDTAGLADPATGEGIDYALRSAALAAQAFRPDRGFEHYPAAARKAFGVEMRRARLIRHWLYHPGLADTLVRRARRSPRWALLLISLLDAINEHGSLRGALLRSLVSRVPDRQTAKAVCECPDGPGASAPTAWANEVLPAGAGPEARGRTRAAV
jgi:flavin-dependent dehydrogenase